MAYDLLYHFSNHFMIVSTSSARRIRGWRLLLRGLLPLLALGTQSLVSAASFSLAPASVTNLYTGAITLQITGLTNGETILVERFLDVNGNGTIDAGEPILQSYRLTDGQVSGIAGVRNGNIPGDDDLSVNGQITSTFSFSLGPEFARACGNQIFRISSPGGRFSPLQQQLIVAPSVFPQHIVGTVSNSTGPLAYSMMAVLDSSGNFVAGTVTDGSGRFSLGVPNGTYQVVGVQPGYVGSFATSPQVMVAGSDVAAGVPLSPATYSISGTVTEAATGTGVPGEQFFTTSANNEYTAVFSDAAGNFDAQVIAGQWKFEPSDASLASGGYFRNSTKVKVTVTSANVSGVNIPLTQETAMLYGTVKDGLNNPLPGVVLFASDSSGLFQSSAVTDASGNYYLPLTNSVWYVGADSGLPNGYILQQAQVALTNGQAMLTSLVAQHATAYLAGRAVDGNGNPISRGSILAFLGSGTSSAQLASDGSFALPVWGGSWTLSLETQNAASFNVVCPQLTFNVTDGISISNINYVAPIATTLISGWVRNSTNGPIVGVNVYAFATIGAVNYIAGLRTDANGNYTMPVTSGNWTVGVDSQSLQQLGYPQVPTQIADTSSGGQTVNFLVGASSPVTLTGFQRLSNQTCQFLLNGSPNQNYTVQFCTDLAPGNWSTLVSTNSSTTPIPIVDPSASNSARFYRVRVGP